MRPKLVVFVWLPFKHRIFEKGVSQMAGGLNAVVGFSLNKAYEGLNVYITH